jgi:GT2 family glycosyltransferase
VTAASDTTVVVVPRESFSPVQRCVEDVVGALRPTPRVICVDGGSPRSVRRYLEAAAARFDFTLVRADRFVTPNEARNLALPYVDTEFVLFMDYETELPPDGVSKLEARARTSGAQIVGPMYLERRRAQQRVHMVGGENHIVDAGTSRWLRERHVHAGGALTDLPELVAGATEQVEFHCMLVRRDVFDRLGPLDEQLRSVREHLDLCLRVREHGGEVWSDPDVTATYASVDRMSISDRVYWLVRWSDEWNRASLDHFAETWDLSDDDPGVGIELEWTRSHRWLAYRPYLSVVSRGFGRHRHAVYDWFDPRAQALALRWHRSRAAHAPGAPRVAHAASWLATVASHG